LSQDHIAVPCAAGGNAVHESYGDNISFSIMLYDGNTLINPNNNIEFKKNDVKIDSNNITLTSDTIENRIKNVSLNKGIFTGDSNIECIVTYNGTQYKKTLLVDLEETPYELELNKNILVRNINTSKITDTNITARVKYWYNGVWNYTNDGVVKLTTTNGNDNLTFGNANTSHYRTLTISGKTLENNTTDTEVRISYYKDNKEVSYEIIGIVNSGRDGNDGESTFKSTVFTRHTSSVTKQIPDTPTGGDYNSPTPTNVDSGGFVWSDGSYRFPKCLRKKSAFDRRRRYSID
jgi:hypothetical protein